MKSRSRRNYFALILTTVAFAIMTAAPPAANGQNEKAKLPPGNWTLATGPYTGAGHETLPVDVFSVTTDAGRGLTVTRVSLLNRTSRDVSAVKLRWYLKDKAQNQLLLEGETQSIDVAIPAGKEQTLSFPVVSFARICGPLVKGGILTGNYRLEVAVGEVTYAEASARSGGNE